MTLYDKVNDIFNEGLNQWLHSKARGTAIIPPPLVDKCMILVVLHRVYGSKPNTYTTIIVEDFNARSELIDFITHNDFDEDCGEFKKLIEDKHIKILTSNFIIDKQFQNSGDLTIIYNVADVNRYVIKCLENSKYNIVIYKSVIPNQEVASTIYKLAPTLDVFKPSLGESLRLNTPVEEIVVPIYLEQDSREDRLYKYYTEYIETSIAIFGGMDNLEYARKGNSETNTSATEICNNIAYNNGWNPKLDMTYQYNVKIDELYNPNALAERAEETYRKIRDRRKLVSDIQSKYEAVFNIIKENEDEKVLVINKNGEFANMLTAYINEHSEKNICGNYHDNVVPIPKLDGRSNQVRYKSGAKKGLPVELGAKAQQTLNVKKFNAGDINVLSTSNSPNPDLAIDVDVVIITSPLCSSIKNYLYRFSKIAYPKGKLKLYSIVLMGTIEEKQWRNKTLAINHTILNKSEIDENNYAKVIVV